MSSAGAQSPLCPPDGTILPPKTYQLDSTNPARSARPRALGVAPELVNGKIKGYVATFGSSIQDPGQLYPFRIDAPVPPRTDAAWTGLNLTIGTAGGNPYVQNLSGGNAIPKVFGLQGVHVQPQLTFVTVAAEHATDSNNNPIVVPSHYLSVVDTVSDVFNPQTGELDLALLDPDDPNDPNDDFSGEVPEGLSSVITFSGGQRRRTTLVQAYHEGTLCLVDWSTVTSVQVTQEVPIDLDYYQWPNVTSYLGVDPTVDPEGNLNRGVAVAQSVGSGPNQGKTLVFCTLNFEPCSDLDDGDDQTNQACTWPDDDEHPDEGPHDYLVTLDFTNYPLSGGVQQLASIGHTQLTTSPFSDQGTVCALAVNHDQDRLYVLSRNQDKHAGFPGNTTGGETEWLYVLDITQGPPHPITFSKPFHEVLGLKKGDLRPTSGHAVIVHNPNLATGATERLYVPTEAPKAGSPVGTNDGVLVVLNLANKDNPSCWKLIDMDDAENAKSRNVTDLVALPATNRFLGNDLARNVLLATMFAMPSNNTPPYDEGRLAIVEDR